jgi:DNA-binding IclR family transcriptional regulator
LSGTRQRVGTVARTAELIRYLAEHDGEVTVTAISRDLSLAPSTVHRLLHLLIDQGFVERGVRFQSYRVGMELYRLGNLISRKVELAELAGPFMEALAKECGDCVMLFLYVPSTKLLTLIRSVPSSDGLTYVGEMWRLEAVAWGASGRSIVAHMSEPEQREIHATAGNSPVTGKPLPAYPQFRAELAKIRERGYANTKGQKVAGAVGFSAPVYGPSGKVTASLCLTIPEFRFEIARTAQYGEMLCRKAAALSRAAGNNLPSPPQQRRRA